jgi:malonyl-CoA/methylmalonyl-CoA synthetase
VIGAIAVLRLGAVLVPVDQRQSDLERSRVLDEVDASLLLGEPRDDRDPSVQVAKVEALEQELGSEISLDRAEPADLALIIFTSGTTGRPKGAMITHGNLAAQADALTSAWSWSSEDRLLSALPLFHVHGLVVALLTSLSVGGSIVLRPRFEAEDLLSAMVEHSVTMCFCVPTMLHRLRGAQGAERVARLRLLVSGSAPLSGQLHAAFSELGQRVLERYGMTESLLTFSNPVEGERRAGTVGFPLPGVTADLPAPGGGERELRVKGPGIFAGYWQRPDATREVLVDGWLSTGDIVRVDEDGYTVICGRSKELIITGGFNVYPNEVEELLLCKPAIHDAAVVGIQSEEWGEEVVAYVVVDKTSFDIEALSDALRKEMSPYKVPRRFVVVDALPRNALGKLLRNHLR